MAIKDKAILLGVFLLVLNGVPTVLIQSGVAEDLGVDPSISGGGDIDKANDELRDIQGEGGFGSTLFSLYTSMATPVKLFMQVLFGAELMFISMGMPSWLVDFLLLPKAVLVGFTMIYVLAGRRL